jgi:hypothetical protein
VQLEKQLLHTTVTDPVISIVLKTLYQNVASEIRCDFQFASNVTDVSDQQTEKRVFVNREEDGAIDTW